MWILGRQYDLSKGRDVVRLAEVISERQEAQAPNDLAMIAHTILSHYPVVTDPNHKETPK